MPDLPVDAWVERAVQFLLDNFSGVFDVASTLILRLVDATYFLLIRPHPLVLPSFVVTLAEGEPVSDLLDRVTVEVDLEFVPAFGVVTDNRDVAGDRVTDVDDEGRASFTAENVQVCDVQANVLTGKRGVEMVRHGDVPSVDPDLLMLRRWALAVCRAGQGNAAGYPEHSTWGFPEVVAMKGA
jgi:hypothetical protein